MERDRDRAAWLVRWWDGREPIPVAARAVASTKARDSTVGVDNLDDTAAVHLRRCNNRSGDTWNYNRCSRWRCGRVRVRLSVPRSHQAKGISYGPMAR